MTARTLNRLDRALIRMQHAMEAIGGTPLARRPSPGNLHPSAELSDEQRSHAAGLMRINHTGEVCAQALYVGQAMLAKHVDTRAHLLHAAREETDHLAWCAQRLRELQSHPSRLNALWYAGSFSIGAAAAAFSDRVSLGFVVETERQVEAHLDDHLRRLPDVDARSRAVLEQMQSDEARHAEQAQQRGGQRLPMPVAALMHTASKVMKAVAYRI